jgi:uncharacterized phiE125 gp8 family phage protein
MWYDVVITDVVEPVALVEAKAQCRIDHGEEDGKLALLIAASRDHAEKYCSQSFASATLSAKVSEWCDLASLPTRPIRSAILGYVDVDGANQIVPSDRYTLKDRAIVLLPGASWPCRQSASPITVTLEIGGIVAAAVKQAILLRIEDLYVARGSQPDGVWTAFDSLLSNHRY